jgi:hypothetical protein
LSASFWRAWRTEFMKAGISARMAASSSGKRC